MKLLILTLGLALLAAGCADPVFGPMAIPAEYEVVSVAPEELADRTEELKQLQNLEMPPYRICPLDRFNVSVYEHPEVDVKDIVVTPDGFLSLPLVGPVKVGGLTLDEAIKVVRDAYAVFIRNPKAALIPIHINGYAFTITGRVQTPGRFPIASTTRLLDAIAMARGLDQGLFNGDTVESADLANAYISRDGRLLPVDFRKALLEGDALHNIPLQHGDYIYIPSIMNTTVCVLGEVRNPTYVGFKEGMTLLKALAFARGLTDEHSSYAQIIRGGLQNPTLYNVNVDKMLAGKTMDFPLEPNDILYFPKGGLSEYNVLIRKIMPTLQSLSMMAGPFGNPSSAYLND